ncbi:hypothetical protein BH23ACT9_BH23ACT9_23660 [soil metagenome]
MLDLPSRVLLAVTSALAAFALTATVVGGPGDAVALAATDSPDLSGIPDFALQPALPAGTRPPITATGATQTGATPNDATPTGATPTGATATDATPTDATPTGVTDPDDEQDEEPAPPITIAFAGDIHGEPPIDQLLRRGDNPLEGVADLLGDADLAVVNLETAVGTLGRPADKTYTFQADPALATALADAGVDVVTLANNHALDYGIEAADETRAVVEGEGMAVVGYGRDAEDAYAAHVVDIGGRTVAVVGLSRVLPVIDWAAEANRPGMASAYDTGAAVEAVRAASALADHVVVTIHWGQERWVCPNADQVSLARALSNAGADVIAGHHPHVLQGLVTFQDTLIAYSVGNFVFYARTPATRQSGVLTVTLGGGGVEDHLWSPAVIDGQGRPQPVATQAPIPSGEQLTMPSSGPECGPPS